MLERFMTHFCLVMVEGANVLDAVGAVGAAGVVVVLVVVLALLVLLVYCLLLYSGGDCLWVPIVGGTYIFLVSIPMWGCLLHPYQTIHHPVHPYTTTPLLPHFSGAIFGKYTHLFMQFNIFP